ncbi:ATP-binding protein [Aestuariirhabdus sp. Z084]|uniref:cache domain-containing protein n=1 Tax=Aestuariirhabdus haliotis TaxID=2918751 RepID=UPI00201B3CED|nr:cache domain-containing protein [Aestuariirhabdus haliotis]MCL6415847.1 ATP-binding protein [Aestuariirhabdus haliotis]MCL6419851.1 ATP-binding protein [Aestuariirhabdus haliotis]
MKKIAAVRALSQRTPSIFSKMFFSFVIVPVIPVLALLYLTYNAQNDGEEYAKESLIGAVDLIGANIDKWVDKNLFVSTLASRFDEVVSMDPDKQKPILRRIKENSTAITAVRVDAANGWAVARSDDKPLKNYSDRKYFQQVKAGEPVAQQVIMGKTQKKPLLCFTVPVHDKGVFTGALSQCATLDDISNNVTDLKIGETGFAFLVDDTNKLVAYGGSDKKLSGKLEDMGDHPALKTGGMNELFSYSADNKKIAYKASVGLGWTLVVQQDYNEAFAIPIAVRTNAIITVVVTVLACFFIVFVMSRAISKPLDQARQENDNILGSVNDGLFLIDKNYNIGKQQSSNLSEILQKENLADTSFMRYLADAVPIDVAELARDYIDLLFEERVKEALVQSRNPLKLVQTSIENEQGQLESKYLSLTFTRVFSEGLITNLLVTAKDITQETLLKAELEKIKEEKNEQVSLLAEILYIPSDKMHAFLGEADTVLGKVNDILEQPGSDLETYKTKVNTIFQLIHKIKGDAAAINFEIFSKECHEFEELLTNMRQQTSNLTGNEFLPVTLALKELFKTSNAIKGLLNKVGAFGVDGAQSAGGDDSSTSAGQPELGDWVQLRVMAERLAGKYNKDVEVHFQGFKLKLPEGYQSALKDISTQLIRNSLVHGIEGRMVRRDQSKIKEGQITISIKESQSGGYTFVYKDDGQGIDYENVRTKVIENGKVSAEDAAKLKESDLLKMTFEQGVSVMDEANLDAGRGVGLPLVVDTVKALNGKINVASNFGKGFMLKVSLPKQSSEQLKLVTNQ